MLDLALVNGTVMATWGSATLSDIQALPPDTWHGIRCGSTPHAP